MNEWKDITSYSRGKPTIADCWDIKFGPLRLVLMAPNEKRGELWRARCEPFFESIGLKSNAEADAKREAVSHLVRCLTNVQMETAGYEISDNAERAKNFRR